MRKLSPAAQGNLACRVILEANVDPLYVREMINKESLGDHFLNGQEMIDEK